ncbi:RING-CH-type domain-containing protein [Heracleum sosnowskyi]|uniref:RING-CH-type domain-containing protein n=1 Tax=Heracleum sosnowskyi TaxID=360622 RepID=A0AAD8GUB4_9APIA|nr:RING-CH-type domain-containing protein [Heracleum sosnowskyi]
MESFEITCFDLECGNDLCSSSMSNDDEGSLSFSDAYESSSYSQFYSTPDGSSDGYNFDCETNEVLDSKRVLTVGNSDSSVDIVSSVGEFNVLLGTTERDCRICHLSLQVGSSDMESGICFQLGCSCKNDMAVAHQHCAETWFRIKGNTICEICKSIAQNVVGSDHIELPQQASETINFSGINAALPPVRSTIVTPPFPLGHLLLHSMFACIVFAVVLLWIFHFHMAI